MLFLLVWLLFFRHLRPFCSGKHSAGSKLSNPELDFIYRIRERDFSRTQSTQSDSRTRRWDQSWISGRRSSRASAQPSGGTRGNGHLFLWRSRRVNCFLLWGLLSSFLSTPSRRHPGSFHLLNPAYSGVRAIPKTSTIILLGLALSALGGALNALVLSLSPNPFAALEIVFWQMGSLADRTMSQVYLSFQLCLLAGYYFSIGRAIKSFRSRGRNAVSLGVEINRLRLMVIIGSSLAVGAAVSVVGVIGFIGLIVPHLLRPF